MARIIVRKSGVVAAFRNWIRSPSAFRVDSPIGRVDEQLRGFLTVPSDGPKVFQCLREREVLVEQERALTALPPALSRLDHPEEPRHQAIVGTRGDAK
jgi:hypothetical protein